MSVAAERNVSVISNVVTRGEGSQVRRFPFMRKCFDGFDTKDPVGSFKKCFDGFFSANAMSYPIKATCVVGPNGKPCDGGNDANNACTGTVKFEQTSADECTISWNVKGLAKGLHGFHIHEFADFSNGCISAGPHYNPHGLNHGGPDDEVRHVGDLGNITAGDDGVSAGSMVDKYVKLQGEYSVVGRSVMVLEKVMSIQKFEIATEMRFESE